jgi:hypothetical protein
MPSLSSIKVFSCAGRKERKYADGKTEASLTAAGNGNIRAVTVIKNTSAPVSMSNYDDGNCVSNCFLDDPYEGILNGNVASGILGVED